MAIRVMCDKNAPGAERDEEWSKTAGTDIYMHTTHVGLVLELREYNMRDDSDFYAVVWNPVTRETERVTYASTRGWTYPNGALVDATAEVRAAYDAKCEAEQKERAVQAAVAEAATPYKGKRVKIIKAVTRGASKCAAGLSGVVVWYGRDKYCPSSFRVGVKLEDTERGSRTVFLKASNVKVVKVE